ncbi:MAG: hypothetical protein V7K27_29115 [Nostoc sp.]|uniref:hypothetical protein n=1 Tax=Nostoc sp. TaxID=1180 RepID=UPI002FF4EFFA
MTTGTVYLEDKGVFLQGHQNGADGTEFWGNAGISPTSDKPDGIASLTAEIKDPRQSSNATRYSIKDTVLAAFAVFFMQCESFLEHQRQMYWSCGKDKRRSLFGFALGQDTCASLSQFLISPSRMLPIPSRQIAT